MSEGLPGLHRLHIPGAGELMLGELGLRAGLEPAWLDLVGPSPTPRVSLKLSSTSRPDVGSLGLTGLPSPPQGLGPDAHHCFSGAVLQPEGIFLIQLLQLQL